MTTQCKKLRIENLLRASHAPLNLLLGSFLNSLLYFGVPIVLSQEPGPGVLDNFLLYSLSTAQSITLFSNSVFFVVLIRALSPAEDAVDKYGEIHRVGLGIITLSLVLLAYIILGFSGSTRRSLDLAVLTILTLLLSIETYLKNILLVTKSTKAIATSSTILLIAATGLFIVQTATADNERETKMFWSLLGGLSASIMVLGRNVRRINKQSLKIRKSKSNWLFKGEWKVYLLPSMFMYLFAGPVITVIASILRGMENGDAERYIVWQQWFNLVMFIVAVLGKIVQVDAFSTLGRINPYMLLNKTVRMNVLLVGIASIIAIGISVHYLEQLYPALANKALTDSIALVSIAALANAIHMPITAILLAQVGIWTVAGLNAIWATIALTPAIVGPVNMQNFVVSFCSAHLIYLFAAFLLLKKALSLTPESRRPRHQ
jgi:hypothetical protein